MQGAPTGRSPGTELGAVGCTSSLLCQPQLRPCTDRLTTQPRLSPLVVYCPSVMSDSLRHHRLQHARLPCPSPSPGVCSKLMSIESVMPSSHLVF